MWGRDRAEGFRAMLLGRGHDPFVTSVNPALACVPHLQCRKDIEAVHYFHLLPNITRCMLYLNCALKFAQLLCKPNITCSKLLNCSLIKCRKLTLLVYLVYY